MAPLTVSLVPFEGGAPREVLANLTAVSDLGWFPDSRSLVYAMMRDGISNLWRLEIDGRSAPRQLTHLTRAFASSPAVSPDGKQVAYHRGQEQRDIVLLGMSK